MPLSGPLLYFLAAGLPLAFAILLDLLVGDPPENSWGERVYPPVLVGRLALALSDRVPREDPRKERRAGVLLWAVVAGVAFVISLLFLVVAGPLLLDGVVIFVFSFKGLWAVTLGLLALGVTVFWVKSLFTISGLSRYCLRPLGKDIAEKRQWTARVVNRPTAGLSDELLNSALIESLAENTTDSVVSPLLYYAFFGLPGLVIYRSSNTLDALLGHRERKWRYVGAFSAAVDRILNVPGDAISGLLLGSGGEKRAVVSPGATDLPPRSIVAASRALRVRLERSGSYVIGEGWPLPTEDDVRRAAGKVKKTGLLALALAYMILGVLAVVGWTFFL